MAGSDLKIDLRALLKRAVELVMPNLRSYYRVTRKAKIEKTYLSDGHYWADVQPCRNDDSVDYNEPVIPKVEIPVIWAGPKRGIVCPPVKGTYCDLSYYDGDPNYPRISNFRWHDMEAPEVEIGGLIIQRQPGTAIKIDCQNNIIEITPANQQLDIGQGKTEKIGGNASAEIGGNKTENVGGTWTVRVAGPVSISAPQISLAGNLSVTGIAGGGGGGQSQFNGQMQLTGNLEIGGNVNIGGNIIIGGQAAVVGNLDVGADITASGSVIDGGGNTNHHGH